MFIERQLNISSLAIIQNIIEEIVNLASEYIEDFATEEADVETLQQAGDLLYQVEGAFKMVDLQAAILLCQETRDILKMIEESPEKGSEQVLSAVGQALVALPLYLEHTINRQSELPALLLPYINEVKAARRQSLIDEKTFFAESPVLTGAMPKSESADISPEELHSTARRMRHMYQVGLLGVIRGENVRLKLRLMHRALGRIKKIVLGSNIEEVFWLSEAVLEAMATEELTLTVNRKRLFPQIDRYMKGLIYEPENALQQEITPELKENCLFLIAAAYSKGINNREVREAYNITRPKISDGRLGHERKVMLRPNEDTVTSVVAALKEELSKSKHILESSSEGGEIVQKDLQNLLLSLNKTAHTLKLLEMNNASNLLKDQVERFSSWTSELPDPNTLRKQMLEAADVLLYIDSAVSGLNKIRLTGSKDVIDSANRDSVVADSHLHQARQIVLEEIQANISLSKRAIESYVTSNFEEAHIANLSETLNSVRGALLMLGMPRPSVILVNCVKFIQATVNDEIDPNQINQMLETLADALISLEHYFIEMASTRMQDDTVLEIAEESLEAIGYPVEAA